ncbi:MAG: Arabinose operon regulatory protein [Lentisphaerae bacterium ADurb.Bin242]|nr:MAG: Arabinose operon regulatory protein [Lentisphaerae bacterium ADurb.Bin242]
MKEIENIFDAIRELTSLPVLWKGVGAKAAECGLDFEHTLHCNPFCASVKRDSMRLNQCCSHDNCFLVAEAEKRREPFVGTCHAGCSEIVVPVFQQGKCIEIVCAGPFRRAGSVCAYPSLKEKFGRLPRLDGSRIAKTQSLLASIVPLASDAKRRLQLAGMTENVKDSRIVAVIDLLRRRIDRKIEVAPLAAAVCLSPSRLIHVFKKEMNCSISEYAISLRIEKAKTLLAETSLPMNEVMRESGLDDPSRFCMVFKRETGRTPLQYRRRFKVSRNA